MEAPEELLVTAPTIFKLHIKCYSKVLTFLRNVQYEASENEQIPGNSKKEHYKYI